mgnify:CR=1 FL=1
MVIAAFKTLFKEEELWKKTVGVASFRGYAAMKWGEMATASIIAIIPMLFFSLIAQKYIVKGLTLGSVKG